MVPGSGPRCPGAEGAVTGGVICRVEPGVAWQVCHSGLGATVQKAEREERTHCYPLVLYQDSGERPRGVFHDPEFLSVGLHPSE